MGERKKIFWLSHFVIFPPHSGARIRSFNLLKELSQEFEVTLIMLDGRPRDFPGLDIEKEKTELLQFATNVEHWPLYENKTFLYKAFWFLYSFFHHLPVTTLMLYRASYFAKIRKLFSEANYAAVHIDTIDLELYRSAFEGKPVVLNHHNVESLLLQRISKYKSNFVLRNYYALQARKLRKLEEQVCPQVALNIAVSETDKMFFEKIGKGSKTGVIENGVDISYFSSLQYEQREDAHALIWAGSMHWFPNQNAIRFFLKEVWPLVSREDKDVLLYIVGNSPPEEAHHADNAERVIVTGYVPDIRDYFKKASLYVVPIKVGSGTRLKIVDAFAAGFPVVSTSVGCEGLEVREGENIMIRDTAESFAEAVLTLLKDKEKRKKLSSHALKTAQEKYSWSVVGEKFRTAYRVL